MKGEPTRPSGFVESLNCAIEGILWAVKTQRHMLIHLVALAALAAKLINGSGMFFRGGIFLFCKVFTISSMCISVIPFVFFVGNGKFD